MLSTSSSLRWPKTIGAELARAVGADERADDGVVQWACEHWDDVYADMIKPPFYAAPRPEPEAGEVTDLERLLLRAGRDGRGS